MEDYAAKGDEFEKKAEKKLAGWNLFGSKQDDAADLYDKAANQFKLAKRCKRITGSDSTVWSFSSEIFMWLLIWRGNGWKCLDFPVHWEIDGSETTLFAQS